MTGPNPQPVGNRTVRVLISSRIWPPEVGGPASHGPELGRFLADRGHQVRAVTTAGPGGPEPAGFPIRASRKDDINSSASRRRRLTVLAAARGVDVVYATGLYGRGAQPPRSTAFPLVLSSSTIRPTSEPRAWVCSPARSRSFQAPHPGRRLALLKRFADGSSSALRSSSPAAIWPRSPPARARRRSWFGWSRSGPVGQRDHLAGGLRDHSASSFRPSSSRGGSPRKELCRLRSPR